MADVGSLPTGGYSGAPSGGASLMGGPGRETLGFTLLVLAAASDLEAERESRAVEQSSRD